MRSVYSLPCPLTNAQQERVLHASELVKCMDNLHPMIQSSVTEERTRVRKCRPHGSLASFEKGDFVLVARDEFAKGQNLCLRWRGPRRVVKR